MTKNIRPSDWVSQSEAAQLRGVSRQSISELIRRGRLTTLVIAGKTLVRRSDVEKFQRQTPGPKADSPKGKKS